MLRRLNLARGETIEVKIRGLEVPMVLRRSARARRFSLQVNEARRGATLTMPLYSSFADADEFLSRHLDWLKERVARLSAPVPFTHGAIIPLRGKAHVLRFVGAVRRRGVVWIEAAEDAKAAPAWPEGARVGVRRLPRLYVAGAEEHAPRRLLDWLKRQAHLDLKARVEHSMRDVSISRRSASSCATRPRAGDRARLRERCPSPGGSCSRRPSCSTISPRTRSPISPT